MPHSSLLREQAARHHLLAVLRRRRLTPHDFFLRCDDNGDGVLTADELYGGLAFLGVRMDVSLLESIFAQIDADGDGKVCGAAPGGRRGGVGKPSGWRGGVGKPGGGCGGVGKPPCGVRRGVLLMRAARPPLRPSPLALSLGAAGVSC